MVWLWILVAFLVGFIISSAVWIYRFRDKAPVGCLVEEYDEDGNPTFWLKLGKTSIDQIKRSRYVVMGVIHYKEGSNSKCQAEDHMNRP